MSDTESQRAAILRALRRGKSLTGMDALRLCNSWRLGARVYELRREGHDIKTTMIELGDGKRVASYRLARKRKAA